jgi:hypothetical protein
MSGETLSLAARTDLICSTVAARSARPRINAAGICSAGRSRRRATAPTRCDTRQHDGCVLHIRRGSCSCERSPRCPRERPRNPHRCASRPLDAAMAEDRRTIVAPSGADANSTTAAAPQSASAPLAAIPTIAATLAAQHALRSSPQTRVGWINPASFITQTVGAVPRQE